MDGDPHSDIRSQLGAPDAAAVADGDGDDRETKRPRISPDGDGGTDSISAALPSASLVVDQSASAGSTCSSVAASLNVKLSVGDGGGVTSTTPRDAAEDPSNGMEVDDGGPADRTPTTPPGELAGERLAALRLEAIFLPKFDNESRSNAHIRSSILENVSNGRGYLEATLKHSGSLLLWSGGGDRYYSKNSAGNAFAFAGEVLLRQHFARAWRSDHGDEDADAGGQSGRRDWEAKYRACSAHVARHRLTLSFEAVTSILGHHGDLPRRDFLVLTAVADLNAGTFYTTPQLVAFAQRFRLPHNDIWIYDTKQGVEDALTWYDSAWETAHADGAVASLSDGTKTRGGYYIPSLYPHVHFQGNVLEGLVMRYVPGSAQGMAPLAEEAERLLETVPPERPPVFESLKGVEGAPEVLTVDIREVRRRSGCQDNDDKFGESLRSALERSGGATGEQEEGVRRRVLRRRRARDFDIAPEDNGGTDNDGRKRDAKSEKVDMPAMVSHLLDSAATIDGSNSPMVDRETRRIAALIRTLERINVPVEYKVYREDRQGGRRREDVADADGGGGRYLCIVHVLTDYSFKKYRNAVKGDDGANGGADSEHMPLYRGFSFRMVFETDDVVSRDAAMEDAPAELLGSNSGVGGSVENRGDEASSTSSPLDDNQEPLMLKMKLLPYMIRTFCCRNGLSALSSSSCSSSDGCVEAYDKRCLSYLKNWGASDEAIERWMPFLRGWGRYAARKMVEGTAPAELEDGSGGLPPPSEARYLEHLDRFGDLFYSGQLGDDATSSTDKDDVSPPFLGIVVAVSLIREKAVAFADALAASLGNAKRVDPDAEHKITINAEEALDATSAGGRGLVCAAKVEDGVGIARKLLKKHGKQVFVVLVGCAESDVAASTEPGSTELKKKSGMLRAWRGCRCRSVSAVDASATEGAEFDELVKRLREEASGDGEATEEEKDERPGALVFFPAAIPGCGKSALCEAVTADSLRPFIAGVASDSGGDAAAHNGTNHEEVESDRSKERSVIVRVGDDVEGKYWPLVRRERSELPSSVYVADKNAPPSAWDVAEQVCVRTRGAAVPVLPDRTALRTTTIDWEEGDGGRRVEEFPFSLVYLALCLYRVLRRPMGEHTGKLDAGTKNAAMVVVMFYCLYRNVTAEKVESAFARTSGGGAIRVPVFAITGDGNGGVERPAITLPTDLERVLREAIRLQVTTDGKSKQASADMEERLRSVISQHRTALEGLATPLVESRSSVLRQLGERVAELDRTPVAAALFTHKGGRGSSFIKIVSVDVEQRCVHDVLKDVAKTDKEVSGFFSRSDSPTDAEIPKDGMVEETHVTMAHHSSSSQIAMRSTFDTLVGREVEITATGLLYGEKAAALAVSLPPRTTGTPPLPITRPGNAFPHVTVWFGNGGSAVDSNDLPRLVEEGGAKMVKFEEPITLQGKFRFWMMEEKD